MNRLELAASILIVTLPLAAQTPATPAAHPAATITAPPAGFAQTIVLWPDGAPLAQGTTKGDIPKLFTYPTTGAGPHSVVIVMPGGGYTHEVMEQEGAYEARWLAAHGVAAFVLEYRLSPAYEYPAPMLDASRAIRYVLARGGAWGEAGRDRGMGILRRRASLRIHGDQSQGRRSGGGKSYRSRL